MIDCDVHNDWSSAHVLLPYMDANFRDYLERASARTEPVTDAIVPSPLMPHLLYDWLLERARLVTLIGMGPINDGMGMIHPITSYCDELIIAYHSGLDPE